MEAGKVKQICRELKVSVDEAMFYLEGFDEKLDLAMEACRNKTLPPIRAEPLNWVPVKEKSAEEEPSTPPMSLKPLRLSSPMSNQSEKQPSQSKEQRIQAFREVAFGSGFTLEEEVDFLEEHNWDVNAAVESFFEGRRPMPGQSKSQRRSGFDRSMTEGQNWDVNVATAPHTDLFLPKPGQSESQRSSVLDLSKIGNQKLPPGLNLNSSPQGDSGDESSITVATELMQGMCPTPVTRLHLPSQSRSMENSSKAVGGVHISDAVPLTSQVKNIPDPTGLICDENGVPRQEALFYLEATNWDLEAATESSRSKTLPPEMEVSESTGTMPPMVINSRRVTSQRPSSPEQQPPQFSPETIFEFHKVTTASTEQAIYCLTLCNGNVDQAVNLFYDQGCPIPFKQPDEYHSTVRQSSSMQYVEDDYSSDGFSEEVTSKLDKEAGADKNVTIAVPAPASSQVNKANAVNEDSSVPVIIISINLASGERVEIPFRKDQTVRDIRKAIAERTPGDTREYYMLSDTGFECTKLDITVKRIETGGSTNLIQILFDD